MHKDNEPSVSRRNFFKQSGLLATGLALGIGGATAVPGIAKENPLATLPYPYQELDVEEARKLGYLGYYKNECSAGAFYGFSGNCAKKSAFPTIPFPSSLPI